MKRTRRPAVRPKEDVRPQPTLPIDPPATSRVDEDGPIVVAAELPRKLNLERALDRLPAASRPVAAQVNLNLATDDGMYAAQGDSHYLQCGASALNVILAAQQLTGVPRPASVLDFGAGAGRVTRWLRAAFPDAAIMACDLRAEDMQFCREQFGSETWISGTDIDALRSPRRFDLIWVGSVFTHLSAAHSRSLIDKLLSWTNVGGLLVMSTIGRAAYARRDRGTMAFIHQQGWNRITRHYARHGHGYAHYLGQDGYGLSLLKPSWVAGLIESLPSARLVMLAEGAWDDIQDIVAAQAIEPLVVAGPTARSTMVALGIVEQARIAVSKRPWLLQAIRAFRKV